MLCDIENNVLTQFYSEEEDDGIAQIPEGICGIGAEAFRGLMSVRRIILPEGIAFIAERAFVDCCFLEEIVLPESLRAIGEEAFANCQSLKKIEFPSVMESIGRAAFINCSELNEVFLPDGLTVLENGLFSMCTRLRRVSFPASIRKVKGCAAHSDGIFFGSAVTEIYLRGGWYKNFMHTLNIAMLLQLQELYVQDISEVPSRFLAMAISTFARHENEFSDEVKAHYYEYIRSHGSMLYGVCGHDEEIFALLLRENLILPKDAQGYFFSVMKDPNCLVQMTEYLCRKKLLDGEILRVCLDTAIAHEMTEITAMLLDYGHSLAGQDTSDELILQ